MYCVDSGPRKNQQLSYDTLCLSESKTLEDNHSPLLDFDISAPDSQLAKYLVRKGATVDLDIKWDDKPRCCRDKTQTDYRKRSRDSLTKSIKFRRSSTTDVYGQSILRPQWEGNGDLVQCLDEHYNQPVWLKSQASVKISSSDHDESRSKSAFCNFSSSMNMPAPLVCIILPCGMMILLP